jgi:hypothetical protein
MVVACSLTWACASSRSLIKARMTASALPGVCETDAGSAGKASRRSSKSASKPKLIWKRQTDRCFAHAAGRGTLKEERA